MAEGEEDRPKERREAPIWDRATRIFHWVLVVLVVVCYLSGRNGRFDIHIPAGQALLVLVAARILWGFAGSASSRFRAFIRPVREIAAYLPTVLRREPDGRAGHNPLGGLSVAAMLLVLALQASLGLFAVDVDGLYDGPLSFLVSYDAAREAAELHAMVVDAILILVGLHLAAVLFHLLYKRENLTRAMLTGRGRLAEGQTPPRIVSDWRALLVLALAAAAVLGGIEIAARVF
ncbi:MAG: Ni/Fe-hydrogenase 1 b-type cytochrome subunit [Alphaproteobacteria bacterium]|nr:Ni/Fe-hydrogenase 1 b-type cytochrome subunit [Alphaproteobacteria bacterium]